MWLTIITPPSYSYVSFWSVFIFWMPQRTAIKKYVETAGTVNTTTWHECVCVSLLETFQGYFMALKLTSHPWPCLNLAFLAPQLKYRPHCQTWFLWDKERTLRHSWSEEVRRSLTQIPCRRTWRSCGGPLCLLQKSWMFLTGRWQRRSWFPSRKPCAGTTFCPDSTRMDWDGPKMNSTSLLRIQRSLTCLWFCSVLVRETLTNIR